VMARLKDSHIKDVSIFILFLTTICHVKSEIMKD
jgi:hypothetical protein